MTHQIHPDPDTRQVAALCLRPCGPRGAEVLLVTSRSARSRWILPKGWPVPGETQARSAAIEAWEEAGVRGRVIDRVLGVYCYDKRGRGGPRRLSVAVYPMRVTGLAHRYPEVGQRRRRWVALTAAPEQVGDPELACLLRRIAQAPERLFSGTEPLS